MSWKVQQRQLLGDALLPPGEYLSFKHLFSSAHILLSVSPFLFDSLFYIVVVGLLHLVQLWLDTLIF